MKSPSEKQIKYVEQIANALGIDFPRCDCDFSAQAYWNFINKYQKEYKDSNSEMAFPVFPLWINDDDIFFGYDEGLWEY